MSDKSQQILDPGAVFTQAFVDLLRQAIRQELQELNRNPNANGDQIANEPLLDVEGIARALGIKRTWIYEQTRRKRDPRKTDPKDQPIPHLRVGRYPRFELAKVKAWLELQKDG